MKKSSYQKGSAHVVIIIILVAALLGALGFIFWQNFIVSQNDAAQETPHDQVVESSQPVEDQQNADEGYFVLEDWKVKFEIDKTLESTEVLYYERSTNDSPAIDYYAFSTDRIKELGGRCMERQFGDTVMLYRYAEKPVATPDGELINEEPMNGYYYVLTSPIAGCSGFDENGQMQSPSEIEIKDRDALRDSIRKLAIDNPL